jgi:hypothetical protein
LLEGALSGTSQSGERDRLYRIAPFAQNGEQLQHALDLSQFRLHIEKSGSNLIYGRRIARICGLDPVLCGPVPRHSVLLATTSASYRQEVQWNVKPERALQRIV